MAKKDKTGALLTTSFLLLLLLAFGLAFTSFALVYSMVEVENNLFTTGTVQINLNDGKPVISDDEFSFSPGATVKKDFFIKNESTCDIYYKLYLQNVSGNLGDVLEITICDGDKVLFAGTPKGLNKQSVVAADDVLEINEKRELQIYFHFPKEAGNEINGAFLSFDFVAEGVQAKNNPDKSFD